MAILDIETQVSYAIGGFGEGLDHPECIAWGMDGYLCHDVEQRSTAAVTSRRRPSSTMRVFCSGPCNHWVTDLTRRTNNLVSWLRFSAASASSVSAWDASAPFVR